MKIAKTMRIVILLIIGAAACGATIAHIAEPNRPHFELRASRLIALPGQPITLTAELIGGEDDELHYCPRVVWELPDGTESSQEGDCPPWEQRVDYVRRWMKHGSLAAPGKYVFTVRLEKPAGHVVAKTMPLELIAAGGE